MDQIEKKKFVQEVKIQKKGEGKYNLTEKLAKIKMGDQLDSSRKQK